MKRIIIAASLMLSVPGCAGMLSALSGVAGAPPQAPAAITNISRTAVDFALNSFDAALYGLDFAMDSGALKPGSPNAKKIAGAGRKVMQFLGAVEAARDLGNSATYEQAFANAKTALEEFRSLLPIRASLAAAGDRPPLTNEQRMAIIHRLEQGSGPAA